MAQNSSEAVALIEKNKEGYLGTLEIDRPYVSAVSYIYEQPIFDRNYGQICFFLSELARHTKNLQKNPQVSLLVTAKDDKPAYERARVTALGVMKYVKDEKRFEELKKLYLQTFPDAERFFAFKDFRFFEMEISDLHFIGGFGKVDTFH
jgi:heme iron utilization protein